VSIRPTCPPSPRAWAATDRRCRIDASILAAVDLRLRSALDKALALIKGAARATADGPVRLMAWT
jgi:hypothetical protein